MERPIDGEIVLRAGCWYYRHDVSFRDLKQILGEQGTVVDHSTLYRWLQKVCP